MPNSNFSATVDKWVAASEQRMTAVFHESTQRVTALAQSRIPIDTGYARASVQASLQAMPPINPASKNETGNAVGDNFGVISAVIAGARLGQTIYIGWTAAYVGFLEYGHSKQAPSGFVRISAMEWPTIVNQVAEEARSRAS